MVASRIPYFSAIAKAECLLYHDLGDILQHWEYPSDIDLHYLWGTALVSWLSRSRSEQWPQLLCICRCNIISNMHINKPTSIYHIRVKLHAKLGRPLSVTKVMKLWDFFGFAGLDDMTSNVRISSIIHHPISSNIRIWHVMRTSWVSPFRSPPCCSRQQGRRVLDNQRCWKGSRCDLSCP